jgi:DNA-binding YbaB/EbfC family protein
MNIQKMMKQAQAMQAKMGELQARMELMEFEGQAGSGMVKAVVTGKGIAKKISIDDSLIDKTEKDMLEDLVVAAFNDAKHKSDSAMSSEMSAVTSGLALPAGMKLPF